MGGVKAPKDPEKKQQGFYIIHNKEVFGTRQPDGRGIHYIYEDNGRLINSAVLSGNIQDERILECLKTAEGFRSLVHSIGVCIETKEYGIPVEFVFQMYGKKDIYGGGTVISKKILGDGMEYKIPLSEVAWSEDDKEPGQIQFCFEKPETMAKASVRLYVNEGFQVPEEEMEEPINLDGEDARKMLERSLMSIGNPFRLKKVIEKARKGEEVTLAYIGGSITQGAGAVPINTECYAWKSCCAFAKRFSKENRVNFIKAGVGGTPSELGMLRFERDVLRQGEQPDLVVIEFAVNDEGDETKGICYESLVRKVLGLPWSPAVVLLFSVFANDWNLQERLSPIGEHYQLPMVSVLDAVSPQFGLKPEEGRVITKNQYFYDMFHPTNEGHTVMAQCLDYLFEVVAHGESGQDDSRKNIFDIPPILGKTFEHIRFFDRKDLYDGAEIMEGSFHDTDVDLQAVEMDMDTEGTLEFPYNWQYNGENWSGKEVKPFRMKIFCKNLVLVFKDSGAVCAGKAKVLVDGEHVYTADPLVNGWTHCNAKILFEEQESREHIVEIQMEQGEESKKFTILGFGYVI
ncbi:MAG: SGNH/GDSL hydrolase family protein [Candidatus Ruminococcus intestinipullorum]|nr:SGNH/GDSL hydrolase family protein [Candidatus Ruminococcus intestinipullorum]